MESVKKYTAERLYTEIEKKGPRAKPFNHPEFKPLSYIQDTMRRPPFVYNYSWAIPTPEAITEIAKFVGTDKCLEVGAGRGLWAFLLKEAGVSITATDAYTEHTRDTIPEEMQMALNTFDGKPIPLIGAAGPSGSQGATGASTDDTSSAIPMENIYQRLGLVREDFEYENRMYTDVEKLTATEAIEKYCDHTCLMICWGRCGGYDQFQGNKIVFIGEADGGCTTEPPSSEEWDLVKEIKIPRWEVARDFLGLYRRKA